MIELSYSIKGDASSQPATLPLPRLFSLGPMPRSGRWTVRRQFLSTALTRQTQKSTLLSLSASHIHHLIFHFLTACPHFHQFLPVYLFKLGKKHKRLCGLGALMPLGRHLPHFARSIRCTLHASSFRIQRREGDVYSTDPSRRSRCPLFTTINLFEYHLSEISIDVSSYRDAFALVRTSHWRKFKQVRAISLLTSSVNMQFLPAFFSGRTA